MHSGLGTRLPTASTVYGGSHTGATDAEGRADAVFCAFWTMEDDADIDGTLAPRTDVVLALARGATKSADADTTASAGDACEGNGDVAAIDPGTDADEEGVASESGGAGSLPSRERSPKKSAPPAHVAMISTASHGRRLGRAGASADGTCVSAIAAALVTFPFASKSVTSESLDAASP
jgi:hypothetical protein